MAPRPRRPRICSIYLIENVKRQKVYVGSSVDTAMRWNAHLTMLLANKHPNFAMQLDWNRDGGNNFTLRLMVVFSAEPTVQAIRAAEQKVIDLFPAAKLYNIARAAAAAKKPKQTRKLKEKSKR